MPDLTPGQNRRLGRIAETNPERAKKVAARMNNRVYKNAEKEDEFITKSEARLTREKRGEAISGPSKYSRPDTPLAKTPPPITDANRQERSLAASRRGDLGPKIIGLFKKNK